MSGGDDMFCGACGQQLEEGALFCGGCGAKAQGSPAAQEAPAGRYSGYDPEATLLLPQDPAEAAPAPAREPAQGGGAWWKYAALLALLLLLCGTGGYYVVRYLASLRGTPPQPVAALPAPAQPAPPEPAPAEPQPVVKAVPKPVKKPAPKKVQAKVVPAPQPAVHPVVSAPAKVAAAPAPVPVSAPVAAAAPAPPAKREPLRVGGNVQEAKLIRRVAPVYPELAKRSRAEGAVVLEVNVDEAGNVSSVRVLRGHPLLNDEAMRAVKQWKYSPTLLNGEAVPIIATVTVVFKLN
jgi:protein TonB